jgi:hypothetical protein
VRRLVPATILAFIALGSLPAGGSTTDGQLLWKLIEHPEAADFSQPGVNQPKYFTAPVAVQAGKTYTIVIFGEADEASPRTGTSYSYDGVWQYDYKPSSAQPNPQRCCIDMQISGHEGHTVRPGDTPAQSVPFESKTHYYKVKYVPSESGNLEVRDVMRYAQGYTTITGQITFELYSGSAPASGGGTKLPPISSPTAKPKLGVPIDYRVMALGATGVFQGWTPNSNEHEHELDTELTFIDSQGHAVPTPPLAAIQEQSAKAGEVCYLFSLAATDKAEKEANKEAFGFDYPAFSKCVETVSRVLARADQIRKQKRTADATAAAASCPLLVRGSKGAKRTLRITCTATATGARIRIRAASGGTLRGPAPQLVVARSSIPASGATPARLRVKWTAH